MFCIHHTNDHNKVTLKHLFNKIIMYENNIRFCLLLFLAVQGQHLRIYSIHTAPGFKPANTYLLLVLWVLWQIKMYNFYSITVANTAVSVKSFKPTLTMTGLKNILIYLILNGSKQKTSEPTKQKSSLCRIIGFLFSKWQSLWRYFSIISRSRLTSQNSLLLIRGIIHQMLKDFQKAMYKHNVLLSNSLYQLWRVFTSVT